MTFDDLWRRAALVRELPLERVLERVGAARDRRDRQKWHTDVGPLSVTGSQFMNWRSNRGGGGAIDLVMHLVQLNYGAAVVWLETHVGSGPATASGRGRSDERHSQGSAEHRRRGELRLPWRNDRALHRVRNYLLGRRSLPASLVEPLIDCGRLYADGRANAVFLLVAGKSQRAVGAELRGTGPRAWRGMAPGTDKSLGYFWIGVRGSTSVVLCESAIDAISCLAIHPGCVCISTAGARPDPRWLGGLLARGYQVKCGYDADQAGDAAARQMIRSHPSVERLRPSAHDWNDLLAASS